MAGSFEMRYTYSPCRSDDATLKYTKPRPRRNARLQLVTIDHLTADNIKQQQMSKTIHSTTLREVLEFRTRRISKTASDD